MIQINHREVSMMTLQDGNSALASSPQLELVYEDSRSEAALHHAQLDNQWTVSLSHHWLLVEEAITGREAKE